MKNIIFFEITGVLTERYMDKEDVEHIRDFTYIDNAINNLKKLCEETNSILIVVDLERWATTDEYNKERAWHLKHKGLNIDGHLFISSAFQERYPTDASKDIALDSIMKELIKRECFDINRMAYIKQGAFDEYYNQIGNGIYALSLFTNKGLTKECARHIKNYLLNGYKLSDSSEYVVAHKEDTKLPYDLLILKKPYEYWYPRIYLEKNNEHFPILIDPNPRFLGKEPLLTDTEKSEILIDVQEHYHNYMKYWDREISDKELIARLTDVF